MTKEEIKNTPELVDFMLDKCVLADSRAKVRKRLKEVCDMAIKALEQEPCGKDINVPATDAISRQAVNALVDELARAISDERCCISRGRSTATIMQDILDLPPVTPQSKTGHWIDRFPAKECKCSVCDFLICISNGSYIDMVGQMKYCPNCGAKMVEPQESEVQNADSD